MEEAKNKLKSIEDTSIENAEVIARKEYKKAVEDYQVRIDENKDLRNKYESMLHKVKNWIPPSDNHIRLKEFMIEQLNSSIDFDCSDIHSKPPVMLSGALWLDQNITSVLHDIQYHLVKQDEENKRTAERNVWVKLLRDSLTK
jgi:hypothetical protein